MGSGWLLPLLLSGLFKHTDQRTEESDSRGVRIPTYIIVIATFIYNRRLYHAGFRQISTSHWEYLFH